MMSRVLTLVGMAKHSKTNPVDDQFMIKRWMCKLEEEIVSSTIGGSTEILSSEASPIFWKAPDKGLGLTTFDAWRSQKNLRVVFSCFLCLL
jgi:hypothetical protein